MEILYVLRWTNLSRENDFVIESEAGTSGAELRLANGPRQACGPQQDHACGATKYSKCDTSGDKLYPQKSHIPISTQSAAMNVAVKLR